MADTEKKIRGRPRRYLGVRPNWTIRLDVEIGDKIKEMATTSGRSISEICERQIVDSFRLQDEVRELQAELYTAKRSNEAGEARIMFLIGKVNDLRGEAREAMKRSVSISPEIEAIIELTVKRARAKK